MEYLRPHGHQSHAGCRWMAGGGTEDGAFVGSNQRGTQSQHLQSASTLMQNLDAPGCRGVVVEHGVGAGVGGAGVGAGVGGTQMVNPTELSCVVPDENLNVLVPVAATLVMSDFVWGP